MSNALVTSRFENSYPEDETPEVDSWSCSKCNQEFIDPEDYPYPHVSKEIPREPRLYWLSVTEPVCEDCALKSGLPPVDKE